ncbi:ATP-binding protein, partial [Sphaerisporangium rufum]|uniref:ATP-binding protein n=1 Tax=Sphaerisporangium rufum TaxID=1381558 RepID=UPI00194E1C80
EPGGDVVLLVASLRPGSAARRARGLLRQPLRAAGVPDDAVHDCEITVSELAANAERHAPPPYELRVFLVAGVPAWCEVVDADPEPGKIGDAFDRLSVTTEPGAGLLAENGRGLLLAHRLSAGHCAAYRTSLVTVDVPGKAVAFTLPSPAGHRPAIAALPPTRPDQARLRRWT